MTRAEIKARLARKVMLGSQGDRIADVVEEILRDTRPTGEQMAEAFVAQSEPVDVADILNDARMSSYAEGLKAGAEAMKQAAVVAVDQVKDHANGPAVKGGINKAIEAIEGLDPASFASLKP